MYLLVLDNCVVVFKFSEMRYDAEIKRTFESVALEVLRVRGYEFVEVKLILQEMRFGKLVADF